MEPTQADKRVLKLCVCGPMTGLPNYNYPAFHDATRQLREVGYEVICPTEQLTEEEIGIGKALWHECMKRDIKAMFDADALALLPAWSRSKGANLEVELAGKLSMPSRTVEEWLVRARGGVLFEE